MYKIHLDYEPVKLNIVTAKAIKKYHDFLFSQIDGDAGSIADKVKEGVESIAKNGEVKISDITELVKNVGAKQILQSLEIFYDENFIFDWLGIIFLLEDKDYKKDWQEKISIDEFIRGMQDFFLRLRQPLKT